MTKMTDILFNILSTEYESVSGKPMEIAELGSSTEKFRQFITTSVSNSVT